MQNCNPCMLSPMNVEGILYEIPNNKITLDRLFSNEGEENMLRKRKTNDNFGCIEEEHFNYKNYEYKQILTCNGEEVSKLHHVKFINNGEENIDVFVKPNGTMQTLWQCMHCQKIYRMNICEKNIWVRKLPFTIF